MPVKVKEKSKIQTQQLLRRNGRKIAVMIPKFMFYRLMLNLQMEKSSNEQTGIYANDKRMHI